MAAARPRSCLLLAAVGAALVLLAACGSGGDPFERAPLAFVALGDQGTGDAAQQQVADAVAAWCAAKGCDFVLTLGDNVYPSGVASAIDPLWVSRFEVPYAALEMPFYASLGNHDYGASGAGTEFGKGAHEVAYAALNPKWRMPAAHYAFDAGPATFLALDTNLIVQDYAGAPAVEGTYFGDWLAASTAPWRIAYGHHPYISASEHGNAGNYDGVAGAGDTLKAFYESTLCGRVDLFLAGHDHNLQLLDGPPACPGTFVVSGGGGAALYGLPNRDGNSIAYAAAAHGFAYVEASSTELTVTLVDDSGTPLFARHLVSAPAP